MTERTRIVHTFSAEEEAAFVRDGRADLMRLTGGRTIGPVCHCGMRSEFDGDSYRCPRCGATSPRAPRYGGKPTMSDDELAAWEERQREAARSGRPSIEQYGSASKSAVILRYLTEHYPDALPAADIMVVADAFSVSWALVRYVVREMHLPILATSEVHAAPAQDDEPRCVKCGGRLDPNRGLAGIIAVLRHRASDLGPEAFCSAACAV